MVPKGKKKPAYTLPRMFSEEEMPQGSKKWLAWRESCIVTASGDKLKAIVGDPAGWEGSPQNHQDVRDGKEAPWTDEAQEMAAFGSRHEAEALEHFNSLSGAGLIYKPICIEVEFAGKSLGASLDGYAWDEAAKTHRFVEVKCPAKLKPSATWRAADDERVPEWYLWQVAMQTYCLEAFGNAVSGVFYVFVPPGFGGPDHRAVQLNYELLEDRIDHIHDRLFRFIKGQPERGLWRDTDQGMANRVKSVQ